MEQSEALVHRDLDSLKEGKVVAIVPQGISMLPFIVGGEDRVFLVKKEHIAVGDIVLAQYEGKRILHRVYAIDGERITLMGDGNLEGTEQVMRKRSWYLSLIWISIGGYCSFNLSMSSCKVLETERLIIIALTFSPRFDNISSTDSSI